MCVYVCLSVNVVKLVMNKDNFNLPMWVPNLTSAEFCLLLCVYLYIALYQDYKLNIQDQKLQNLNFSKTWNIVPQVESSIPNLMKGDSQKSGELKILYKISFKPCVQGIKQI